MDEQQRFDDLLDRFISKTISAEEKEAFFELLLSNRFDTSLAARIDLNFQTLAEDEEIPSHIARAISRSILSVERRALKKTPVPATFYHKHRVWLLTSAAAVIGLICILLFRVQTSVPRDNEPVFASLIPDNAVRYTNTKTVPDTIILEDKSRVVLQPQTTLYYPSYFADTSREVYLDGSAFFTVTPNARQPFYVYCNTVVTKVLGTSFEVGTNSNTGNIEVVVKTGKVQMFENRKIVRRTEYMEGVIVTPNQKGIYMGKQGVFETAVVDLPEPANTYAAPILNTKTAFIIEQQKLSEVFKLIEEVYKIDIVTENEAINNCIFSGDISQQDLNQKLHTICLSINAEHETIGDKILIKGEGCNL